LEIERETSSYYKQACRILKSYLVIINDQLEKKQEEFSKLITASKLRTSTSNSLSNKSDLLRLKKFIQSFTSTLSKYDNKCKQADKENIKVISQLLTENEYLRKICILPSNLIIKAEQDLETSPIKNLSPLGGRSAKSVVSQANNSQSESANDDNILSYKLRVNKYKTIHRRTETQIQIDKNNSGSSDNSEETRKNNYLLNINSNQINLLSGNSTGSLQKQVSVSKDTHKNINNSTIKMKKMYLFSKTPRLNINKHNEKSVNQ